MPSDLKLHYYPDEVDEDDLAPRAERYRSCQDDILVAEVATEAEPQTADFGAPLGMQNGDPSSVGPSPIGGEVHH